MDDLRAISAQFLQLQGDVNDDTEHENVEQHQQKLKELLTATCGVVDQENGDGAMVEMADDLINHMVSLSYEEELQMDLLESFAHGKRGIITDPTSKGLGGTGAGDMKSLAALVSLFDNGPARLAAIPGLKKDPYYSIERPHKKSSLMARFRKDVPRSSVTDMTPSALAVFQARLSMSSTQLGMPIQLSLPPNSSCMAILQAGGYKLREPLLTLVYCDIESEYNFCKEVTIEPGLLNVAYHIASDAERKLIYIADEDRIKSYEYRTGRKKPLPKHTLQAKSSGPIALIQNGGRILRAGKTGIDIWTVDTLPDHGPDGSEPIGDGEIYTEDTWRDETDTVELSTGTEPGSTIKFAEGQKLHPSAWSTFQDTRTMLLAPTESVSCFGVDLETGCKITSHYLGHGGQIRGFSTSPADANSFLTSCDDGIVRLFDIRESLPYLSVDAGARRENISSALYIHVDGLPLVITGGQKSEAIKVWDPRAKAIVYELATGNNFVTSMAWDAPRSTLFAATECTWMDRLGYHHEYRSARIPRQHDMEKQGDGEDDEEEEFDDDDEDEFERYWPEGAHHDESYFGYAMDAGEHRLYRYKFGVDADPSILPDYGQARPSRGGW